MKSGTLNMTFEDFVNVYKEDIKPRLRYNTWVTKEHIIDQKILPYFASKPMSEITTADVIKWQNIMINDQLGFSTINLLKDRLINSVESLKVVKNHSSAGKGWIKIEWSTTGDDGAVAGYEIYKSTKKNSGYKYAFTTKNPANKWYKNTAGLKKGTRYYYKVRAIIEIDGEKYTSDWSNKAYRIAK